MRRIFFHACAFSSFLCYAGTPALGSPAADYCREEGGIHESWPDSEGHVALLCRFGRGFIGDTTFYRAGKLGEGTSATEAFFRHEPYRGPGSTADPEYFYCDQLGGRSSEHPGSRAFDSNHFIVLCTFADGSQMEGMTLLRGPNHEYGRLIAERLKNAL